MSTWAVDVFMGISDCRKDKRRASRDGRAARIEAGH
jgi:hypothetical protein